MSLSSPTEIEVENTDFLADDPCPIQLLRINDKSVKHTTVTGP